MSDWSAESTVALVEDWQPTWKPPLSHTWLSELRDTLHQLSEGGGHASHETPEALALRDACRWDVERFATEFFPHLCRNTFSKMHRQLFAQWQADQGARGLSRVTVAPRGGAKTTIIGLIKTVHDIVYQHERYIGVISSRAPTALDRTMAIREELESNDRLIEVYGEQVTEHWNQGDFITTGGVRVRALSPRSSMRGLLWRGQRPTKLLLDDAEDERDVYTAAQRQKFANWYQSVVRKLGSRDTNFEIIGTILHRDALMTHLLDNPGYQSQKFQAVLSFNHATALWQEWRSIFVDLHNPHRQEDAYAFFLAHEAAMLEGADVLWPEEESYYELMVQRVVDGDAAFWKEKQGVLDGDVAKLFAMHLAGYFTNRPEGMVRRDGLIIPWPTVTDVVGYWDPALGDETGRLDFSALAITGKDQTGTLYALDAYLSNTDPLDVQLQQIVALLWQWDVSRVGLESNAFQSLLVGQLRAAIAAYAQDVLGHPWDVMIVPVVNTRAKARRISTLQPLVANQWLWFADTLPPDATGQLADYEPGDDTLHDDYPDALEGSVRVARGYLA